MKKIFILITILILLLTGCEGYSEPSATAQNKIDTKLATESILDTQRTRLMSDDERNEFDFISRACNPDDNRHCSFHA